MAPSTNVSLAGMAGHLTNGRCDGAPVVLLHGLTFDHRTWGPVVQRLEAIEPRRTVLALDLPGHGDSPGWAAYDVEGLAEGVHRAVAEAQLDSPVVVGHSMAAVVATVYGARHATGGIVNVDQPLRVADFARMVRSLADDLRGPGFAAVWERFATSMHAEVLPPDARRLVASTSRPSRDLVVGYWRDALTRDPEELDAWFRGVLGELRSRQVPYVTVVGDTPDNAYVQWLARSLPQGEVVSWPGSGHFPHLAHPDRFAELLVAQTAA